MEKTKLAYVIDTIETDAAGTQKQLIETIKRLDKSRFIPELICLRQSEWMENNSLPCNVSVMNFHGFLKTDCISIFRTFGRLIDNNRFNIVHTFFEDSTVFAFLGSYFARTRPMFISSRRDIGLGAGNHPWYHYIYKRLLPLINKRYDYVIANSHVVKEYACQRERLSDDKVKVIYNGVEVPDGDAHEKPSIFRNQPHSTIWICVVASLTPVKRHDLIVRAISHISHRCPELPPVRALFLGEGPQKKEVSHLAKELGVLDKIEFVGAVDNVGDYLQNCDIGVLCSDREGLSNAILEYMSYKLPVVATLTGGNSELVTNETGKCVPVGDAQVIADALVLLIEDPIKRHELGLAGYRRVLAEFSWTSAIENIQAFYDLVLDSHRDAGPQ